LRQRSAYLSLLGGLLGSLVGGLLLLATPALAAEGSWTISSASSPTNFSPGDETGEDTYVLTAVDTGGIAGGTSQIDIADTLPSGISAIGISGEDLGNEQAMSCTLTPKLGCTYEGFEMAPGDVLQVTIAVAVKSGAASPVLNSVKITGGGVTREGNGRSQTTIGSLSAGFGVSGFSTTWSSDSGAAHANVTAGIIFNQVLAGGEYAPSEAVKDFSFELPPGFTASGVVVPRCTTGDAATDSCPGNTAVGVVFVSTSAPAGEPPKSYSSLVYSVVPAQGTPEEYMFNGEGREVRLRASFGPRENYRLRMVANDISQIASPLSMELTLWGIPAQYDSSGAGPDHVSSKPERYFGSPSGASPAPFLTNSDVCGEPTTSVLSIDSWLEPATPRETTAIAPGLLGCGLPSFEPALEVLPDTQDADAPVGYALDLLLPQSQAPTALATADLKTAIVELPLGAGISLSATNGLSACSEAQIGLGSSEPGSCPDASILGTVEVLTPLMANPLVGHLFLSDTNLFGSTLAVYVEASAVAGESGIFKLSASVKTDPVDGRVSIVFNKIPQLPLSELRLRFDGGPRALFANPSPCGPANTESELIPWGESLITMPSSFFEVQHCVSRFAPTFKSIATPSAAGVDQSLALTFSRTDQDGELGGVEVQLPESVRGLFAKASTCSEMDASQGTCPVSSGVGTTVMTAGAGSHPVSFAGGIYLTGPYRGASQGLSMTVPLLAGPFNLGMAVIRATLETDPATGQLAIVSDRITTIVDGIPLRVRSLELNLEGSEFAVDPSTCEPFAVTGAVTSTEGASVPITAVLPPAGCVTPSSNQIPTMVTTVVTTSIPKKASKPKPRKVCRLVRRGKTKKHGKRPARRRVCIVKHRAASTHRRPAIKKSRKHGKTRS
jgi:hypothetical protein